MKLFASLLSPALVAAALSSGCVITSTKPPPPPTTGTSDPMLTSDGRWFAAERTYQGECAPAGSRGGCYSITLRPDGSYRHMLLDAPMSGTYVISGNQVTFTPSGPGEAEPMTLSADRSMLGTYVYQAPPSIEQTAP